MTIDADKTASSMSDAAPITPVERQFESWLDRTMRLRVLDTETTGIEPPNLQVVEVATIDLIGQGLDWRIDIVWSTLINPGKPIPFEAMGIHNITNEMVAHAPKVSAYLASALTDGKPDFFIAHNAKFDRMVLEANGIGASRIPWLCTYKAAVTLWPDAPNHKNSVLRYFLNLNLPQEIPMHRAYGDVQITAAIAQRILQEITVEQWALISAAPVLLPRVHFGEHRDKQWSDVPLSYLSWIVNKSKGAWDEDALFTAKHHYDRLTAAQRSRSPV